jgi:hypothetical protein
LADALTGPHAVAAVVLCIAGIAKLRAPGTAAAALTVRPVLVRSFALLELMLGAAALVSPAPLLSALLAATYAGLAGLTLVLARRSQACGCFGEGETPASISQSILSAALALVCGAAAVWHPHALGWILGRPAGTAAVLVVGTAGAVYGTVVAYSELPLAWRSWSAP